MSDAQNDENAGAGHTPTPWRVEHFDGSGDSRWKAVIGNAGQHVTDFVNKDDCRRIVASVNALAELTVEAIEKIQPMDFAAWKLLAARVAELEQATGGDVRRAKACVDACRNFATEDLEKIGFGPYEAAFVQNTDNDGVRRIALERVRQVIEKRYNAAHDDAHDDGSIAKCAGLIALGDPDFFVHDSWEDQTAEHVVTKYSGDRIRQLSIAGALIAAEIDRLRRATPPAVSSTNTQQM